MLELIADGAELEEVLNTLNLAIERISPGALCTVMLLDEEQRRFLSLASGPSLPRAYIQALSRLEIGPNVGACGTAAFLNETVVVEDIATDPKFAGAGEFVISHGLRSCWSQPVRDSRNRVLGTFAIYHAHPARPRGEELTMARVAAQLAGNAIERIRAQKALQEAGKRLKIAESVARFGIWEIDLKRGVLTISKQMALMMERRTDRLNMTTGEFEASVHPDDIKVLRTAIDPVNARGGTIQNEFRLILPGGAVRWMRSQFRFELNEGSPGRATGAMIDITDEMNLLAASQEARAIAEAAAIAARQAEKLEQDRKIILEMVAKDQPLDQIAGAMARAIASHFPDSMCVIRIEAPDGNSVAVCSRPAGLIAERLSLVDIGSINQTLAPEPLRRLSDTAKWQEFADHPEAFPCDCYRAAPILRNSRLTGMIVCFHEGRTAASPSDENLLESWGQFASLAVERRGLYEQLSFRAQHDSLTALLNRASLYDRVDAQILHPNPDGGAMAVLYFDLDGFKEINDRYGHAAGDGVLQEVSRRILQNVRRTDFAARIGGDEFVVILPGISQTTEAARVSDLLIQAIEEPIPFGGAQLNVGASCGISIFPENGVNTDALLKKADEEMYRAKTRRRSHRPSLLPQSEPDRSPAAVVG